jgi:hypothetical protein
VWATLGATLSPLVVLLTSLAVESAGYNDMSGRGTVDAVSSIISLDGPTYFSLLTTTGRCSPPWPLWLFPPLVRKPPQLCRSVPLSPRRGLAP